MLREDSLAKALREAEHLRVFDMHDLRAAMARTRHRPGPGHARLTAVLDEHRRRGTQLTRSILEQRFLRLCDRHRPAPAARQLLRRGPRGRRLLTGPPPGRRARWLAAPQGPHHLPTRPREGERPDGRRLAPAALHARRRRPPAGRDGRRNRRVSHGRVAFTRAWTSTPGSPERPR